MVAAERTPRRDRVAIAGSIAIHLCVLVLAATTVLRPSLPLNDPDERTLLSTLLRIEHREPPHRAARAHPVVHAAAAAEPAEPAPVIHAAVTREHASHRMLVAAEHRAGAVLAPVASVVPQRTRSVTPAGVAAAQPVAAQRAEAAATSAPSAAPAPSPIVAQRDDGIGNFGETYPASIDPSLRGAVLGGVNGVVVRVAVDENGHPTAIEFLRPPADPAQREELRTRLLAAHFIPAACNGLRCAGTVELKS